MENKNNIRGLGAALVGDKSYLFLFNESSQRDTFVVRESEDGINFDTLTTNAKIVNINGPADKFDQCSSFHVSQDGTAYYLTYRLCGEKKLCVARSKNLIDWEKIGEVGEEGGNGKIVSNYLHAGRNIMFTGGDALHLHVSEDFEKWSRVKKSVLDIEETGCEVNSEKEISVIDAQVVENGIFVMYSVTGCDMAHEQCKIYGALFDYGDPTKLIWKSKKPIYQTQNTEEVQATIFGAAVFDEYFVSYWTNDQDEMFLLRHFYNHEKAPEEVEEEREEEKVQLEEDVCALTRVQQNPILAPRCDCPWEAVAAYNPAAIEYKGKTHIIYRADGDDLMAVWGYAASVDGITIDERPAHCIYQRKIDSVKMPLPRPMVYTSGNSGNGGCEDPRAVLIDDEIYVTFTAFDGWGSLRVALTSIDVEDFVNKRWNWKQTRLISPPGEYAKNWMLFSEKVNGKFALLHSFRPEILIEYFDSLDELDGRTFIKSNNTRPVDSSRSWDSWFRCVGPPPLKTSEGWLVFYQAMDHKNPDRYRMGALLLDLDDPTKEICRSRTPILEPEEHYENHGNKWGVVFSCGAVIKDDHVFVYYGGADKYVCVATAPLQQFLDDLKRNGEVKMNIN